MSGFVYAIHAVGTNRVKIGFSKEPEKRVKELQTGSPFELELLAKWPGTLESEYRAHQAFEGRRCVGEWFEVELEGILPLIERSLNSVVPGMEMKLRRLRKHLEQMREIDERIRFFMSDNGLIIQLPNVAICQNHKMMHFGPICPIC